MFITSFIGCIYKKVCTISFPQNNEGFDSNEKSLLEIRSITQLISFILQIKFEHISGKKNLQGLPTLLKVSSG